MVGLQARQLVSVRLAKKLIAEGKIGKQLIWIYIKIFLLIIKIFKTGKVLSVTLIGGCGTGAFAPNVLERNQYLSEINNGIFYNNIKFGNW